MRVVNNNSVQYFAVLLLMSLFVACGGGGSTGSDTSTAPIISYIKASNTEASDQFGASVALSADGNTLAVGAPYESSAARGINGIQLDNLAAGSGAVYAFTRTAGTWTQEAYIKASNAAAGYWFGGVVSLSASGLTLVVGAANEASAATGIDGNELDVSASYAGAVYVFSRTLGKVWAQQAYVKASKPQMAYFFGSSVSLSDDGKTLAVGAPGEGSAATGINGNQADNSAWQAGAVYLVVY